MDLIDITIPEFFRKQSLKFSKKVFMEYFGDTYTYRETDIYSDVAAERLKFLGVEEGQRVAVWAENSPVWIIWVLALSKIGALPVLVNTSYKADEIENVLSMSRVSHIIYGSGHKGINFKEVLWSIRLKGKVRIRNYIEMPQTFKPEISGRKRQPIKKTSKPGDAAVIMYTSGSTKLPRGVLLSHRSLVNNARSIVYEMNWDDTDRLCLSVPLFHCFGFTSGFLAMLSAGASINILNVFRTRSVLECISNNRCTILNGVPSMFISMIRNPILRDYDISSLRSGIIAGAPVIPKDYMNIVRIMGIENLQQSYGQTETSPCITMTSFSDSVREKSVSAGHPCDHQEIRIKDIKTGEILGKDQNGEIEARGYNVMMGYDGLPLETSLAVDEEGWLRTGDLGFICSKGNLHITGRKNDIIIRGGENISPAEIEASITDIPGVSETRVMSVPDEVMTEEIAAAVILDGCSLLKGEDIRKYVGDRIASFKVPKYVVIMEDFPRLESGKTDSRQLKKMILKELNISEGN